MTATTTGLTSDPVHRVRYAFEPDGENLTVETWIEPGGGLPPHSHPRQEERWSVIEGEIRLQLGREKRVITAADGEVVVVPGTVHGFASPDPRRTCAATCRRPSACRSSSPRAPRPPARGCS